MAARLATVLALFAIAGPVACHRLGIGISHRRIVCWDGWEDPVLGLNGHLKCPSPPAPPPSPPSPPPSAPWLSIGYYDNYSNPKSYCSGVEDIVREAVYNATSKNRGIGAGLIRLHFHDCFVRGCDASVLLESTPTATSNQTERAGPPNLSLRGLEVIQAAKAALEQKCPSKVSCADIIAFAARDATYFLSGNRTFFAVPAGRFDGRDSFANETGQLPGPSSNITTLIRRFAAKGLNAGDMVALSGAHTVGQAHCSRSLSARFSNRTDEFARNITSQCSGGGSNTTVVQDYKTPNFLDNQYYKNIDRFVLFASDAALNSTETIGQVKDYVSGARYWESDFAEAMVKMGFIEVKTSANGEIRTDCFKVNDPGY
ncbi:hypothetical protein ACP4OV_028415 [Aristida adscensionis]